MAVPFLGMLGLHLRVQLGSPDESREVPSHSLNNCSAKLRQHKARGGRLRKIKSLMLSLHTTKGPFMAGMRGFPPVYPCFQLLLNPS